MMKIDPAAALIVIPAKAGIHYPQKTWTPAFAGVTALFSWFLCGPRAMAIPGIKVTGFRLSPE